MAKYIFVAGGVMSGIGKGIATASIGRILKSRGLKVTAIKIDPYINVDAGTMNPVEHGEVFVTDDGLETDQDLGNYERFLDQNIPADNYMTTGAVYKSVIERERNLEYGGKCVEVVPHIPEEVIGRFERAAKKAHADVVLVEIGGTVGEYQNALFLEAARMLKLRKNPGDVLTVLVSYLPVPKIIGEMKTKPTQHAVRSLNYAGIQPDVIIARSVEQLDEPRKAKIATFCNIQDQDVISAPDASNIYDVPINFEADKLGDRILEKMHIKAKNRDLRDWKAFVRRIKASEKPIKIAIVGKYFASGSFTLSDAYISVIEAIKHAAWYQGRKPDITWVNAGKYEESRAHLRELDGFDGVVVPGGFGTRGVEGKIRAIQYCRENQIPFFGLCYGLQLAVIEFARNVAGLRDAHTTEIEPQTKRPVICTMTDQQDKIRQHDMGGTMRLGAYMCRLRSGTISRRVYGADLISERHRHRYEVNNDYRAQLEDAGLVIAGVHPSKNLVEIIELSNHPFFVGTQFHPEFLSRPLDPHPLFRAFARAAKKRADARALPKARKISQRKTRAVSI